MTQQAELSGDIQLNFATTAMVAAGTAKEDIVFRAPFNMTITAVDWTPSAAVTANGTNFATVSLRNRTTGAGTALPASRSYAATNSAAATPETMTLSATASDLSVAAGDVLSVQMTVTGTGIQLPQGMVRVTVRQR
jgi:hypothetical protein